jgi:hypothetical protein
MALNAVITDDPSFLAKVKEVIQLTDEAEVNKLLCWRPTYDRFGRSHTPAIWKLLAVATVEGSGIVYYTLGRISS